ncbi:NAD(P)/FAD-dependent oxidoreductase [Arthrobacter crystallopoietes]|uniref:NAD(P)/FAD-dependent oxidoreductase n=1 Tax=Crystallibacter crystallopoietes TaxID=37928 RepID=UPI001ABE2090|nr:NAD(P)/FAD-dependent oxidoreductase [Arthrobacter crystallopoietes]QTG79455.1 FAD-dependent oxidoreductase [Arthrobacter crystallopoietes]
MSSIEHYDVAIIGAGPAGLAAAATAAEHGARVVCIDANDQPGGQFWRHRPEETHPADDGSLHHDWKTYLRLRERFDAALGGSLRFYAGRHVWMAQREESGFTLRTTASAQAGRAAPGPQTVRATRLVVCAGGYDRQLPVPGWDLPGVMAAGGIQAFIKANGMLPGKRFVVAGTGPFLLPVAANLADAGGAVAAVCESADLTGWFPHLATAARVPAKALEGAAYAKSFLKHRIPYRTRTVVTEVLGSDRVQAVRTAKVDSRGRTVPGSERLIEDVDAVGFGWGFTAQLELPVALGAETRVDDDGSLVGVVDAQQHSSVPGLYLAGEVSGVGGAALAVVEGLIAGRAAAAATAARPSAAESSAADPRLVRKAATYRAFARAMHLAHPVPAGWQDWLRPDTTVCRCEEVTAGDIAAAKKHLCATDARTMKSMTRTGMGWCQGKVCGFAVSCLAGAEGASAESLQSVAKRPVGVPVTLSELLTLEDEQVLEITTDH